MDSFEFKLSQATVPQDREILGAIVAVAGKEGESVFADFIQDKAKALEGLYFTIMDQGINP